MAVATPRRPIGRSSPAGVERSSLIALGRRHLVRARNSSPGSSLQALHDDTAGATIWLVAMAAGRVMSQRPVGDGVALQVLQGQVQVVRAGRSVTVFPGELVVGSLRCMEVISLTDCVVLVTGGSGQGPQASA